MPIKEDQVERVMEELEMRCWDKIQTIVKTEESLGIEFDENVICDVCRSVSVFILASFTNDTSLYPIQMRSSGPLL